MEETTYKLDERDKRIYPVGTTAVEGGVHFCMISEGEACNLVLFQKGQENRLCTVPFPNHMRFGNLRRMTVLGADFSSLEYCFEVDGKLKPDFFGKVFSGREEWYPAVPRKNLTKSPVLIPEFDWEEDQPLRIPYEDSVIYRVHVRGLTKHASSRVKSKGTFQGVIEKIPYIKDLGVTTVELMPVNEFDEVLLRGGIDGSPYGMEEPTGKVNYWGYGPGYYFAPKASYSSGRVKNPVFEFKKLVKELHKAGLEVIIELYFCGSENPLTVLEAVRFWVREYHVDGIHLVGFAPAYLVGSDPCLADTKLFATSWDGVSGGRKKHLGEYNDGFSVDMRRVLKGDEDQMNHLIYRSRRSPKNCGAINYMSNTNGFTMMDMVSYEMKHNEANGEGNQDGNNYNYTWNCGVEGQSKRKKVAELRKKQIRNALLLLFLSQGTPLLLSGDEFGNSKNGNNNSYCQDNEISWLNWNQLKTNQDIYDFVKYVIAFRKKHPIFHQNTEPRAMDYLACGHPDISYHGVKAWCPEFENFRRQLGIMYSGDYGKKPDGSADDYFFVAYNMHWEPHEFALPNLPKGMKWRVAFNTEDKEVNGIYQEGRELEVENQKQFPVPARTIVVFIGKADSAV